MSGTDGLLARVRTRLVLAGAAEDLQRGAAAGAVAGALALGLRALGAWHPTTAEVALGAGALALGFPLVGLVLRRRDRPALAAQADVALGLAERLSTAVWSERAGAEAGPLAAEARADAARRADAVGTSALARAFRPRPLRRELTVAAVALAVAVGAHFVQPAATAAESDSERAARLADANRVADVARRMAEAAKRFEEQAKERKQTELANLAATVQQAAAELARNPAPREAALRKLSELSDLARDAARRRAGAQNVASTPEAAKAGRELAELLKLMADSGIENLSRDVAKMQEELAKASESGSGPSSEDLRSLANRIDALRQAAERAKGLGSEELQEKLRSFGNEDLLEQIAQRLRELAAKMDQQGYGGLQGEGGEPLDLGSMSREELEELLKQLDELSRMEDLEQMLRQGGGEMSGGRRLRLGGSGGT